jgi:hypothetical protein
LALTSPTSGGRSVSIRLRTKNLGVLFFLVFGIYNRYYITKQRAFNREVMSLKENVFPNIC